MKRRIIPIVFALTSLTFLTNCSENQGTENKALASTETNVMGKEDSEENLDLTSYNNIALSNQNEAGPGFLDIEKNKTYTDATAHANIAYVDLIVYDDVNEGPLLISPADELADKARPGVGSWASKNKTYFQYTKVTPEEFDAIKTSEALVKEAGVASDKPLKTRIQIDPGKVIAFQIDQTGRYGLAKIVSVSGSTGNPGKVTMAIKMQK